ncbi:hypothetical protein CAEBREN_04151 [Caenorhabditis brenneri]|uniref:Uncharacterized protein n=1 Tax=Caenorhabditis brenneri TaxID=135651 RepID=G0NFP0_CAEBE|nr:hypothetical protein CAEBREN_04151 [Caenorhabditis brenneri]
MVLSKLFSTSRSRDKENEKKYIINGYPLTTSPVIPDILKHQVEFKKIKMNDFVKVGLTLAPEGSDLVKPESLEVIRKKILEWYPSVAVFSKQFESKFPKNLIAISICIYNFEVGESCQEFKLRNPFKPSENSYFSYRKLSECIQCAYYNEDGVEFLAGITFYPAPHGKPQLLKSNNALLYSANNSVITYPLDDRQNSWFMKKRNQYGRFCPTAGKHVLLKCYRDGIPRHYEYNHVTHCYNSSLCKECLDEFFSYKWVEPKRDTAAAAAPVVTVEQPVPAAGTTADAESSSVTRASSTESLIEEFEQVKADSEDVESDIDAELID